MKDRLVYLCLQLLRHTKIHRLLCSFYKGIGLILVLHRVLPENECPRISANSRIEVTPEFLEELITFFLRLNYEVVSLDSVYERLTLTTGDKPFVCFTFDDGYTDSYDRIYQQTRP